MLEIFEWLERVLAIVGGVASLAALVLTLAHYWQVWRWKRQLTWNDALRDAEKLLKAIEGDTWKPDLVIGLGRSGGIWGGWLAGNLGSLPLAVIDIRYDRHKEKGLKIEFPRGEDLLPKINVEDKNDQDRPRVLIIEGGASTGNTFRDFSCLFSEYMVNWDVKYAVVYINSTVTFPINYFGRKLNIWPKKFPWHLRSSYRPFLRDMLPLDLNER